MSIKLEIDGEKIGYVFPRSQPSDPRPLHPTEVTVTTITDYIKRIHHNIFGYFNPVFADEIRLIRSQHMADDISWIEYWAEKFQSSELYFQAAKLNRSYSVTYCYHHSGNDKNPILQRMVQLMEIAISLNPKDSEIIIALATHLIHTTQVRDLSRARRILEALPKMTRNAEILLKTIDRNENKSSSLTPTPLKSIRTSPLGEIKEEQKNCRAVLRALKKEKKQIPKKCDYGLIITID